MIIHSDTALLEELNLSRIHFKEMLKQLLHIKITSRNPSGYVTHSIDTIYTCIDEGLDYVLRSYFPTPSHPGDTTFT